MTSSHATDPVALTRALVEIPSVTGDEARVMTFMADLLAEHGYRIARHPIAPGRDNIYATAGRPELVFTTHLDVVPPSIGLTEDDEWLHGRGTCDAKGSAAAMVAAALRMSDPRVALLFVVGEETGGEGAKACAALEPRGRFLVNGEPTENRLSIGQKGALSLELHAAGKTAHSAYPEEGRSAIELLLDALDRIRALPLPTSPVLGETTLNVGLIEGGIAANVIPDRATASLLYRTVSDTAELETAIQLAAGPVAVERRFGTGPVTSRPLAGWDSTTVKYASDLPHFAGWGEGYQLGPGTIRVAHTADERVRKADLIEAVECYVRLARQLLQ